jgi:hypothetical protein
MWRNIVLAARHCQRALAGALGTSVDYLLTGRPVDDTQLASSL